MRLWCYLLFTLLSGAVFAAPSTAPLAEGYTLLASNRTDEARTFFLDRRDGPQGAEATLALSFIESMLRHPAAARSYFYAYSEAETDPVRRNANLDAVWSAGRDEADKEELRWLESHLDNPYTRLSPLARYALGEHEFLTGNQKRSQAYFADIGAVLPWQVVGPFENISESGFERDFGVLDMPSPGAVFTNKRGVPVGWIPGVVPNRQGWLQFHNHVSTGNAVVYAQTFCASPTARQTYFRLGTGGSARVWVNDELVFSEFHERNTHLDAYVFEAPLRAGNNRILIQIGSTDDMGTNFLLRVTDREGRPQSDLSFTDAYSAYQKASGWEPKIVENPTEAYFRQRIDGGTANYVDYLSLTQFYLLNGFTEEARQVLLTALDRYPDNHHLIAQLIPTLRGLDDETTASEYEQRLLRDAPDNPASLLKRMEDAESLDQWAEYERLIETYRSLYGTSAFTLSREIVLAGGREESERVIELVGEGLDRYPADADFVTGMASLESDFRKRPRSAVSLLEKYLKHHYRDAVVEALINLRLKAGEAAEVIELFDELIERDPTSVNLHARLSRLYYLIGDYRRSQASLDRALTLAPYMSGLYSSQAGIYAEAGDKDEAATAYAKAISLNPYDFDSRDALRTLRGAEESAFADFAEPDYYALYADAPGAQAYPDDNSVVLRYDVQQVVHPGGASESRTTLLVKMLNADGVDGWKEYTIPIFGNQQGVVEKVEVLDADGGRHEASRSGANIVFDRLEAGGAILLVYRLKEYKQGRLAGKFWNEHALQLPLPTVHSSFSLLLPRDEDFTAVVTGLEHRDLQPRRSKVSDRELYVWELTDQPGLQSESVIPDLDDLLATVRVSNIADWKYIADWYSELTYAKIRVDGEVREAVERLFADAPADLTERQQVERIYRFVTGSIRYISVPFLQSNYIPQRAAKTLATGQGDCKDVSSLFVAMCEVRGIDANLVLINTRNRSQQALALPGTGFNHCIARVELEDTPYFVELTDENLPFGTGDWSLNNSFALVIPRRGEAFTHPAGLINPDSRGVNRVVREGTLTFEGGDMLFALSNRKENSVASNMRATYRNESADNRRKGMQNAISDNYPRITLTDLTFGEGLEDVTQRAVGYDYGYRVSEAGNKIGGMTIYPVVLSDQLTTPSYVSTEERKLPIDLWQTFQAEYYEQTLAVVTPAGKTLVEVPTDVTVSNDFLEYSITYTTTEKGLQLVRSLRLKKDVVEPAEYAAFREDVLRIVEADKINLAYR